MLDFDICMGKMRRDYDLYSLRCYQYEEKGKMKASDMYRKMAVRLLRLIKLFARIRDEE